MRVGADRRGLANSRQRNLGRPWLVPLSRDAGDELAEIDNTNVLSYVHHESRGVRDRRSPVKRTSDASKAVKGPDSEPTRAHDGGNPGDAPEIGSPLPPNRGEQARIPLDL